MSVLDVVAGDAVAAYSGAPSWVIPPADGSINTQAFVEMTNPATGETWMAPTGGYTVNPDVTTQIPQELIIPAMQGVETQPVEQPTATIVEGNRFGMQYPEEGRLTDPTVFAAIDILNRAPAVGPTAAAADQSTLLGSGLYEVLPDTDPAIESDVTPLYGVDWRDRIKGTEEQPEGITTTITTDDSSYDDSWDGITYEDFLSDLSETYTGSLTGVTETLGGIATDLGEGFVQIGDSIVDTATGIVTDLTGEITNVVGAIGESITGTLDDFGLGGISDALSDIGVSIDEVATDLGEGFVQIGDAIVDTATGIVTDIGGDLLGVVEDIGENITSTLDDFGLGSVADSLSDLGVSIDEVATDLGSGFVQIGDAIVDSATGVVTDLSGDLLGVVEDIGETITSTLDDFGLGDVSDALSDIGVSIGEVATDLGSGFVQIGDAIVDSATGVVTDLSGDIMGVVEDIGEGISGAVTDITTGLGSAVETIGEGIEGVTADIGTAVETIGTGIEEAVSPVTEALSPITDTLGEVKENVSGFVGDIESVVGDAITSALPDQPDDPEGVGAQYQGEFGAVLSVINNMAEGMTVEEALDALYSDPETGLAPGEVGSPYGWDWGSILDPAYGSLSFTTPYDVVDAQGDPATTDPGGIVTDSEGNPVAVESGGVLGYGDLDTAADVYGTEPGSEQTGMLTEQDAGLTDYSDQNLGTAAEYGTDPGSEQTEMLAEQDSLGFDPSDPDDFTADFGPDGVEGTGFDGAFGSDMGFGDDSGFGDDGIGSSSSDDGWGGGDVAGGDTGAGDTADGGGGDGGGDCFIASTLVDMADGSKKRIDDVVIGDKVLSADGARTNMVKYIEKIDWKDDYILYSPDEENEPFITQNHPVMVDGEWVSSDIEYTRENHPWIEAKPLDGGRRSSGNKVVVYNLWVDGDHTFKVNGYGTSSLIGDGGVVRHGLEQGIIDWDDFVSIVSGAKDAGHLINYGMHLGNRIMAKFSKNKRYTKWILDSVMGKRKGYTIKTLIYLFGAAGILSKPRLWFGERGSFDALETADQGVKT